MKHSEKEHDQLFIAQISSDSQSSLTEFRSSGHLSDKDLVSLAKSLESYLIKHFDIASAYQTIQQALKDSLSIMSFHHQYVRPALRKLKTLDDDQLADAQQIHVMLDKLSMHKAIEVLVTLEPSHISSWCAWIVLNDIQPCVDWPIFSLQAKRDFMSLVNVPDAASARTDFQTIPPMHQGIDAARDISYCLYCHHKDNDACSKGLRAKKTPEKRLENPLGVELNGCPLGQKISEMHELLASANMLAALAVIMIDNPLCAVTGDRICRDCVDACIYQKFDPVETPSVESFLLRQILELPCGPEIYLLLLRWNPLRHQLYVPQQHLDRKVAVVGMGPAGFAMSYYLLMSGCTVVGLDALTLEESNRDVNCTFEWSDLGGIAPKGFGGVMAYGITARWDKRLLDLIWIALRRFNQFSIYGDVRLGGNVCISRLLASFDHVSLATGAGLPKSLHIEHAYLPGMYHANEFLMRLHLSGEVNAQMRQSMQLPILVIGGGLTAVDAATEAQVYYIQWVQKAAFYIDQLKASGAYESWLSSLDMMMQEKLQVWYIHGLAIRQALLEKKSVTDLITSWGGVHIVYHKAMQSSQAYRLNHQELQSALNQGIGYIASFSSIGVVSDQGHVSGLQGHVNHVPKHLDARTILVAIGTKPNVAYYYENRSELELDGQHYARANGVIATSKLFKGRVSVLGDLHPKYAGSVVKAIASAKDGYASVLDQMQQKQHLCAQDDFAYKVVAREQRAADLTVVSIQGASVRHGMIFRLSCCNGAQRFSVKGIVVDVGETITLWVSHNQASGQMISDAEIIGVMGPSGMRVVSKQIRSLAIVVDHSGWSWAVSAYHAMMAQGQCVLIATEGVPGHIKSMGIPIIETNPDTQYDQVLYCVEGASLKELHQRLQIKADAYQAIVDGPLMCMLKGVCAQCVQWQVDEGNQRIKTVFACSWPVQPIELIDVSHLEQRQQHVDLGEILYTQWAQTIKLKQGVTT